MELYYTPEQLANMIASNHKNLNYIDSLVEKGILKVSKTVLPNQIQKMEYYNTKDEHIITMHKG